MLLALAVAVVLPCVDAMVKLLVAEYPVVMVAWARMGLIAFFLGITGGAKIGIQIVRPVALRLQLLRGASAVLGTVMVFLGFRAMPLAECLAIVAVAPFSYASLIVSIALGWLVFSALPDTWSLVGMSIIAAAGVVAILKR